jgi:transposase
MSPWRGQSAAIGRLDAVPPGERRRHTTHSAPIGRFGSAHKLAGWAGLTPTVRGSDLTVRHGHISKQGSAWLRWALNRAAQTAKRSPEFAAAYAAIARRRGKKIATIAIARKLLTRAWHPLSEMEAADAGTPPRRS